MKISIILISTIISLFGFAGGGGSDSGGWDSGSDSGGSSDWSSWDSGSDSGDVDDIIGDIFAVIIVIWLAWASMKWVLATLGGRKNGGRSEEDKNEQLEEKNGMLDYNSTEQEKWIHQEAGRIFEAYQKDWSEYNLDNIRFYTTDRYFQHASLMLEAIDKAGRRNVVEGLKISRIVLRNTVNNETGLPLTVQIVFKFDGVDNLVNTKTGAKIFSNHAHDVFEYWNFIYDGDTLKLDGITQSTESTPHLVSSIARFADNKKMFYSPDWGRLALPTEGVLFDGWDVLRYADVNNHVVGKWNDCLIQMYTYSIAPGNPNSYYMVGQINIPKQYEGVIVKTKIAEIYTGIPKGYDLFEFEWGEFNARYKVYAASKDALTAFELFNPVFMEKLYKRNLPYNLEVKNNVIYIFAKVAKTKMEDYAELLNILTEAFNELKM